VVEAASSEAVDPAATNTAASRRLMKSIFTMEAPWMGDSGGSERGVETPIRHSPRRGPIQEGSSQIRPGPGKATEFPYGRMDCMHDDIWAACLDDSGSGLVRRIPIFRPLGNENRAPREGSPVGFQSRSPRVNPSWRTADRHRRRSRCSPG
jgi:hypothetical protein